MLLRGLPRNVEVPPLIGPLFIRSRLQYDLELLVPLWHEGIFDHLRLMERLVLAGHVDSPASFADARRELGGLVVGLVPRVDPDGRIVVILPAAAHNPAGDPAEPVRNGFGGFRVRVPHAFGLQYFDPQLPGVHLLLEFGALLQSGGLLMLDVRRELPGGFDEEAARVVLVRVLVCAVRPAPLRGPPKLQHEGLRRLGHLAERRQVTLAEEV
mmetsp:Transcript_75153/g.243239  ORF Transcript_75153/g.243239 Transcript_75153/m.243239 type:complete len:212 (-) Transcript_75153:434-1069(-)